MMQIVWRLPIAAVLLLYVYGCKDDCVTNVCPPMPNSGCATLQVVVTENTEGGRVVDSEGFCFHSAKVVEAATPPSATADIVLDLWSGPSKQMTFPVSGPPTEYHFVVQSPDSSAAIRRLAGYQDAIEAREAFDALTTIVDSAFTGYTMVAPNYVLAIKTRIGHYAKMLVVQTASEEDKRGWLTFEWEYQPDGSASF